MDKNLIFDLYGIIEGLSLVASPVKEWNKYFVLYPNRAAAVHRPRLRPDNLFHEFLYHKYFVVCNAIDFLPPLIQPGGVVLFEFMHL